ncbi:sugar ABC transporter permease [uncultured Thermanaerothrix sp.]|uniref:carbohydrate ABC transporter permease n=1 Tax=uncultured Thermanaerothrix sp. TaxID=1195149 RepID=UPI0026175310|nr:sugar ABC transporter permease [uncultured Thermanaerothrix sp.]
MLPFFIQKGTGAMEEKNGLRRFLPTFLWLAAGTAVIWGLIRLIAPYSAGITLTQKIIVARITEVGGFLIALLVGLAAIEVFVYQIFFRGPRDLTTGMIVRGVQGLFGLILLLSVIAFFDLTDLIRLGDGPLAAAIRFPLNLPATLQRALINASIVPKSSAGLWSGLLMVLIVGTLLAVVQVLTRPRSTKLGLAYLLVTPAFIGIFFLILYPFAFEVKLAFSNASLGTQATKNASYGLIYGWQNLVTLFTGNVAKEAKFFEVLGRTVLWTVINVTFHVTGGMVLALMLNRPMRLRGLYRTLLVFPWAIPTTIAAMAFRNEFDSRYGFFNIILRNLQGWFADVASHTGSWLVIGDAFNWLAQNIGPVSWKQDPFWAFVSVLIVNIWLGIPFMMVIILGGLQSISHEYYEAAEIDGASAWQSFWNITVPLLRPVLTPAIILGVVWTFNKFDVIYLVTQGGPQEKTDILVSSMYKAAFQFYRYGFTAMFALVIFLILFIFTLVFLRVSGGLKSATE